MNVILLTDRQPKDGELCVCRVQYDYPKRRFPKKKVAAVQYRVLWWREEAGCFKRGGIYVSQVTHWVPFPVLAEEELGDPGRGKPYFVGG